MTTLLLNPLEAVTLSQEFTVEKRLIIKAVRPYLYFHNDPAGTFTISVKQGVTTLASFSQSMATILAGASWTAGQYHHAFIKFEFTNPLILNEETYTIELSSSGYTYNASSYLGWIKEYEFPTNVVSPVPPVGASTDYPYSFQIWSYTK